MAEDPSMKHAKTRKPRQVKALKPHDAIAVSRVKSTIHLTVEESQRLTVHAAMMGMDRSALIAKLINENLRRYVVSDRGGASAASAGGEAA